LKEVQIPLEIANPVGFFGVNDSNLDVLRRKFPTVKIVSRGNEIKLIGEQNLISLLEVKFKILIDHFEKNGILTPTEVDYIVNGSPSYSTDSPIGNGNGNGFSNGDQRDVLVFGPSGLMVRAKTPNQKKLVTASEKNDIVFAIGPAGTGKTYTAVALAVRALKNKEIRRIILTRPAVEAGENLGFLPGDLKEKIDPYLRPLYDALFDMVPGEKLRALIENGVIEVAPLAFMRGRTLNHSFIILDEAQNTTPEQMKMFLTRIGFGTKAVITGDVTQVDLKAGQVSGLVDARNALYGIQGIGFTIFQAVDVVRHPLVQSIVTAYDAHTRTRRG
jgi:phosphate starvation-inducible PhoH-like protein